MDIVTINNETVALIHGVTPVYKQPETIFNEIPELGDGIGVFKMKLNREELCFPEDFYAMINVPGIGAFEVEIPQILIEMKTNPEGVVKVLNFIS